MKQLTRTHHGYRLGLTPECLRITIAIGQPSTDSCNPHRAKPMGLQTTLVRPHPFQTHRTEAAQFRGVAVGWGDSPPKPKPAATHRNEPPAVSITRPTVGGLTAMKQDRTSPTGRFECGPKRALRIPRAFPELDSSHPLHWIPEMKCSGCLEPSSSLTPRTPYTSLEEEVFRVPRTFLRPGSSHPLHKPPGAIFRAPRDCLY